MTHFSLQELRDWRAGQLDHERARILSHLAACAACAAKLSNMARQDPAVEEVADLTSDELETFRQAGHAAGATLGRSAGWSWPQLATAAVLALAVGATVSVYLGQSGDRITRGTAADTVVLRAPLGVVSRDDVTSFEWNATAGRVRLVVIDLRAPGTPVIDRHVDGTRYDLTPSDRERFSANADYHWFVEWNDAAGALRTSPVARFRVR